MVKFQRRKTEKAQAAIQSLNREMQKKNGTYNTPEVNDALQCFWENLWDCADNMDAICQGEI